MASARWRSKPLTSPGMSPLYADQWCFRTGEIVTPPQLTLSAQPSRLWPVNSGLVPVTFTGTVSDAGSRIATVSFQTRDEYERVQPTGYGTSLRQRPVSHYGSLGGRATR